MSDREQYEAFDLRLRLEVPPGMTPLEACARVMAALEAQGGWTRGECSYDERRPTVTKGKRHG